VSLAAVMLAGFTIMEQAWCNVGEWKTEWRSS